MSTLRFTLFLATACLACADSTSSPGPVRIDVSPAVFSLVVGDTARPAARGIDANGRIVAAVFSWSSTNPGVATVDQRIGTITAVSAGSTTMAATSNGFTAHVAVTVRNRRPAVSVSISPTELTLSAGTSATLQAVAVDSVGKKAADSIVWNSSDVSVALVGGATGIVTAVAQGSAIVTATAGAVSASLVVSVDPAVALAQWATNAIASDEYGADDWSAAQATGAPDAFGCSPNERSWASGRQSVEWLEVSFDRAVLPAEVRIHQVWDVDALVKVEVKTTNGVYQTIFSTIAQTGPVKPCPRILAVNTGGVTTPISAVRITLDQSGNELWLSGIDAVQLIRR